MALTAAQIPTLKAAIAAETDPAFVELRNAGATGAMAEWFNVAADPEHLVWRTEARVNDINDAILWDRYTPTDTIDGTAVFTNRMLAIQTKQLNLQLMLQGRDTINATKANVRAGLRDAVVGVPSGVSGALTSPGGSSGATVLAACTRKATRGEKLYTSGPATTGSTSAFLLGYEGTISNTDIVLALQ